MTVNDPDLSVQRHPPIREQIVSLLRDAIAKQEFSPGQVLVERELCERTHASRPSVREALRQLEAEGLVESKNGRGTIVRVLSQSEADNIYDVRGRLEGLAARRFCERATPEERTRLQQSVAALEKATRAGESKGILAAQTEFYDALFSGAGNPVLHQSAHGLQTRVAQLRATTLAAPGRAEESLQEYLGIAAARAANEPDEAATLAINHVAWAASAMREVQEASPRQG